MDYTSVPRSLIYKDRTTLNEFGVQDEGTFNNYIFTQMRKLTLLRCGDAKEIALRCFNNAYYICTLIQLEEFPDLCMDKYEKKLMAVKTPFPEDVYQASMALVCVILAAYDDKYKKKDNILIDSIYDWTRSKKWTGSSSHKSFEDIIEKCKPDRFHFAPNAFAPRYITEAIKNVSVDGLVDGKEYVIERLIFEDNICINDELENAIRRINNDLNEIYEEWDFNPKTNMFENLDELYEPDFNALADARKEIDKKREAIGYFEKFFQIAPQGIEKLIASAPPFPEEKCSTSPTEKKPIETKSDNDTLQKECRKLTSEIKELKEAKSQADNTIKIINEKLADYEARYDPKDVRGKKVSSMTGKQHVILFLAVLAHHNRIPNARINLSYLMSFIASRNESTMKDYLKNRITEEECEDLAGHFDDDAPFIAKLIRELPEKLEKDKSEKNRNKALKNV